MRTGSINAILLELLSCSSLLDLPASRSFLKWAQRYEMRCELIRARMRIVTLVGLFCCGFWVPSDAQVLFEYQPTPTDILYDLTSGEGSGSVSIFNVELPASLGFPNNVQGWSLSLAHDPSILEAIQIDQGSYIQTVNNGNPPAFWQTSIEANGITIGALYCFTGCASCVYEIPKEIAVISYQTVAATLAGDLDGETTTLVFTPMGNPPVTNVMVVYGVSNPVIGQDGTVNLIPALEPEIVRGDANTNGVIEPLADGITALNYLFLSGTSVTCLDALDCNDDASVNLADPILLLSWGFAMGSPLPAPFPDCGVDPTDDLLSCDASGCP